MMQTQVIFSTKNIMKSVDIVAELYPDLRLKELYYYFPFTQEQLCAKERIEEQIERDLKNINIEDAEKKLIQSWNDKSGKIQTAMDSLRGQGKTILPVYKCNLTFYGSYGYYYAPDIIFLNITKGSSEFWLETLLHEFLHLVLYDEILKLPYNESEKIVDELFIRLFGDMFPGYQKQF